MSSSISKSVEIKISRTIKTFKSVSYVHTINTDLFQNYLNKDNTSFGILKNRFDWHKPKRNSSLSYQITEMNKKRINKLGELEKASLDETMNISRASSIDYSRRKKLDEYTISKRVLCTDDSVR